MSKALLISWSVLSFIISGMFISQGLFMFQEKTLTFTVFMSGSVSLSYGVITIFILSQSWANPSAKYATFTKYLVGLMFVNQLFFGPDVGKADGPGLAGLAIMALMLGFNWLAIKNVTEHKK
jgi:hypothetical protein